jgi:hypothetical protein
MLDINGKNPGWWHFTGREEQNSIWLTETINPTSTTFGVYSLQQI